MENNIEVKEVTIEEAIEVHKNVSEFDEAEPTKEYFEKRYKDFEHLIIVAYLDKMPIGYIIGYDRFKDNKNSFYCWMAGVDNRYRRKGALKALMNYQINWAKEKGYKSVRIKTRNYRREMLNFLVKNNWLFTSIEAQEDIRENRINLEIKL